MPLEERHWQSQWHTKLSNLLQGFVFNQQSEEFGEQLDDALRSRAVAVRVNCLGHLPVMRRVGKQTLGFGKNLLFVRPDEPNSAIESFLTLGLVAHDEDRLAE